MKENDKILLDLYLKYVENDSLYEVKQSLLWYDNNIVGDVKIENGYLIVNYYNLVESIVTSNGRVELKKEKVFSKHKIYRYHSL